MTQQDVLTLVLWWISCSDLSGPQPVKFLLQLCDSLQELLPVHLSPELRLPLHVQDPPAAPTLQLRSYDVKEMSSRLLKGQKPPNR